MDRKKMRVLVVDDSPSMRRFGMRRSMTSLPRCSVAMIWLGIGITRRCSHGVAGPV